DYHGDMDRYREAKVLLMSRHLAPDGTAVVNGDHPSGAGFVAAAQNRRVIRVSRAAHGDAEVRLLAAEVGDDGTRPRLPPPGGRGAGGLARAPGDLYFY